MPTQLGKHWWPEWSLVSGIRVDYLSPTLFLTDIILILLMALVLREKTKHASVSLKRVSLWLLVIGYWLLVTSRSPRPFLSLYWIARYAQIPLVAWVTERMLIHVGADRFWRFTRLGLSTGVLWTVALATAHVLAGRTLGWFWILGERSFTVTTPGIATLSLLGRTVLRPYATFPHPNAMAGFLAVCFLFLMPLQRPNGLFIRFSRAVAGVGVLLSASRLAITSFFLVSLMSFAINRLHALLVFSPHSSEERVILARAAMKMMRDHPLFGVGPGQFLVKLPGYFPPGIWLLQPVHNIPLLVIAEFGLVGTSIIVWIVWKCLRSSVGNVRLSIFKIPDTRYQILLFLLLTSLGDHYWLTVQQNRILAGIVAGLCLSTTTWGVLEKRRADENAPRLLKTS